MSAEQRGAITVRYGRAHCPCGWGTRLAVIDADARTFLCPGCGADLGLGLSKEDGD